MIRATANVPSAVAGISNTPIGPFQTTVRAPASSLRKRSTLRGPMSTPFVPAGIRSASAVVSAPTLRALTSSVSVTRKSTGSTILPADWSRSLPARSILSGSTSELPTSSPRALRKVKAMPPPMRMRSTRGSRWVMTSILPEILAPPRMAT